MMTIPAFPNPGDRITATFMRELMRFIRAIRPIKGPGINLAEGPDGTVISLSAATKPKKTHHRPFEVIGSSGDDYKFAMYVPESVVTIGDEIVSPTGITEIEGADGWYKLDDEDDVSSDGETLYLVIRDDATAAFTFDPTGDSSDDDSDSSDEDSDSSDDDSESSADVIAVLAIAELAVQTHNADTDDELTVGIVKRQLACHPFAIATPAKTPRPFDIETVDGELTVVRCQIYCADTLVTGDNYTIDGTSPIYLHVTRSSSTSEYSISVDQTSRASSATHVQYQLYTLDDDGRVTLDSRPTIIPVYQI